MNITEILKLADNSITDPEIIREIGMLSNKDASEDVLLDIYKKVKTEYQFCGLYPNTIKLFNIKPDNYGNTNN